MPIRLARARAARRLAPPLVVLAAAGLVPMVDVDVEVPPGSPLDWSRSLPAITPVSGPVFPLSRGGAPVESPEPCRTRAVAHGQRLDVRFSSSYDLTRILTLDIVHELDWIRTRPSPATRSGPLSSLPVEPQPGDPMYWTSLAALLRLMLHPSEAPRSEVEVHLIETGLAVLPVLDSARGQAYLRPTLALVRERVAPRGDRLPAPLEPEGASPYERMLYRFVFEELVADNPHDPIGSFGRRLFPFGDDLEPFVAAYADHGNAYLRRAAVSALGRYRSRQAADRLLWIALKSEDPVAFTRALASLGRIDRIVDAGPLVARLEDTDDLHERTALIGALGRLRSTRAVQAIARIGEGALARTESDLLVTVMTALASIPARGHAPLVAELADDLERRVRQRPLELRPGGTPPVVADRADDPRQRAQVLTELAAIARARQDPLDPDVQRALLGLLAHDAQGPVDPRAPGASWLNACSLARLQGPSRFAFVELLGLMEEAGTGPLLGAVRDPGLDAGLRGHALTRLPMGPRHEETARLLEQGLLRVHALHLAWQDRHPRLEELARAELERGAELPSAQGAAESRYLVVTALRVLGERRGLRADDVLPLLHHAQAPQHAFGDLPERVRAEVEHLVTRAAAGMTSGALAREARRLVDLVVERGLRTELARHSEPLRREVLGRLDSARAHRGDALYLEVLARDVRELLLGFPVMRWSRETAEFHARVPLEEEILLALGRTGEPAAIEALAGFLLNRQNDLRSFACLALGATGERAAAVHAAPFLMDPDPFTRWCAYLALSHLLDTEVPIDWMYGPEAERHAASQRIWKRLLEPGPEPTPEPETDGDR